MMILIRAGCILRHLLNEQDLRTSTPRRWRKSCSFSKCLKMHAARIKLIIDNHNRNIILN